MRVTRCVLAAVAPAPVLQALLACGGETAPSDDAPAGGTTATGSSAMNTPASPAATQPQDSSGASLDEYLAGHGCHGPRPDGRQVHLLRHRAQTTAELRRPG